MEERSLEGEKGNGQLPQGEITSFQKREKSGRGNKELRWISLNKERKRDRNKKVAFFAESGIDGGEMLGGRGSVIRFWGAGRGFCPTGGASGGPWKRHYGVFRLRRKGGGL